MTSLALPLDAVATQTEPWAQPSRKGTLLVIDDEDTVRQSLRVIFKDDYQVFMAADGATAIDLAKTAKVDVAILDIKMAAMSGLEVLERLKYVDPSIEVVMLTAYETVARTSAMQPSRSTPILFG